MHGIRIIELHLIMSRTSPMNKVSNDRLITNLRVYSRHSSVVIEYRFESSGPMPSYAAFMRALVSSQLSLLLNCTEDCLIDVSKN